MKKVALVTVLLALTGCALVDNYEAAVKTPVPAGLVGYWQTSGPQSALVSPQAVGGFIVTREGDTLDCRQWQRVIARPGTLMLRDDSLYNVTRNADIYRISPEGNELKYDGMTMVRVAKPTTECVTFLVNNPLASPLP